MSTITTLNDGDTGAVSRTVINQNLANLNADKAELASPVFTGTPSLPTGTTAVTQAAGDNSTKIATTAYVAALTTVETTVGTTHSLTTTVGQRVIVWAKGTVTGTGGGTSVSLLYNGVTKDSQTAIASSGTHTNGFCLMYTETPGAATQNITVTGAAGSVVIIVLKLS